MAAVGATRVRSRGLPTASKMRIRCLILGLAPRLFTRLSSAGERGIAGAATGTRPGGWSRG